MHVQHKCSYENIIFLLTPKKKHTENGMYLHTVYSYIYIYIIKRDALLNGKKQWGKHLPLIRMRCRIVHTQTPKLPVHKVRPDGRKRLSFNVHTF